MKYILKIIPYLLKPNQSTQLQGIKRDKNCNFGKNNKCISEPYFITIGNDFSSSNNVNFVIHDGSMRVLMNIYSQYSEADNFRKIMIYYKKIIVSNVIIRAWSISIGQGKVESNSIDARIPFKRICSIEEHLYKNKSFLENTKGLYSIQKKTIY